MERPPPATFLPDLIVEVTTVCDRACPGCYSPTLRSVAAPEDLLVEHPDLYLTPAALARALEGIGRAELSISLRGGEPSKHPLLDELVIAARPYAREVFVETHARWVLDGSARTGRWLDVLRADRTQVKISFDRMHGIRAAELYRIVDRLDAAGVLWLVAITEPDRMSYERTRATCSFVGDERLVFQHKVRDHRLLVQPPLGTIGVSGSRHGALTTRSSLRLASHAEPHG